MSYMDINTRIGIEVEGSIWYSSNYTILLWTSVDVQSRQTNVKEREGKGELRYGGTQEFL